VAVIAGHELYYTIDEASCKTIETISIHDLTQYTLNNYPFLNMLRKSVGLDEIEFDPSAPDL
jgi:hypothetical protein